MNWRETARSPRILFLDARSLIPLFMFLFHMRFWTFCVAVVGIALFAVLEQLGYNLEVLFRLLRVKLISGYRPAMTQAPWRKRCRR